MKTYKLVNTSKQSIVNFIEEKDTVCISGNKVEETTMTLDKLNAFRFMMDLKDKGYTCYV